ncbi:hypothetical protein A2382_00780 [Candidatus Woesebacteria bacterium RIFOXYB1_FULL_38_16]|uniref:Membrane protein 6-pyruvoyl-tetrahydropterin synthase-related domain-containing protein n=1 Tax=Candidatus Woesebacteria bacterium RIFOXYB1_FULL_38_16 TaxID=1802538 RepID=A0A1F8CUQ6_9BACT|nr:MAG: hypothetical protein A2382_00780 [Candidatus Woesebacteria bacterium RIFOXYB1_FULL_38_16]
MQKEKLSVAGVIMFIMLILPFALILRGLLVGSLVWGDAPYFYPEGLKELMNEPYSWMVRGNGLGGINQFIWIWPIMWLYGFFFRFLGLENNWILFTLFYFPGLVFSYFGSWWCGSELGLKRWGRIFASLIYGTGTYFLSLIDGGVVGLVLAYGLFPVVFCLLLRYLKRPGYMRFLAALLSSQILIFSDPRVFGILFGLMLMMGIVTRQKFRFIQYTMLFIVLIGLNLYWLYPLFVFSLGGSEISLSMTGWRGLIDSLTLHSPLWPDNLLGLMQMRQWYFYCAPVFLVIGLWKVKKKKYLLFSILFLFFGFLAKGTGEPFGRFYAWLMSLPFGYSLRDATKFYIPTTLMFGMMIGMLVDSMQGRIKWFGVGVLYCYILLIISPMALGKMNFVLSNRSHSDDLRKIYENLKEKSDVKTIWFPEVHPLGFQTNKMNAFDAKALVDSRIFGRINAGSYDRNNYLNQKIANRWYDFLGIRYLILSGDQRKLKLNEDEQMQWQVLLDLLEKDKNLKKVDWGLKDMHVYENEDAYPPVFGLSKMIIVVGDDGFLSKEEFNLSDAGFIFIEDGKFDPNILVDIPSESANIMFNSATKTDLTFSFLQDFLVSNSEIKKIEWSNWNDSQYLDYKYQLLIRDLIHTEFDYSRGLKFSSVKGEKIEYGLEIDEDGQYVLGIRRMVLPGKLGVFLDGEKLDLVGEQGGRGYQWISLETKLSKGRHILALVNESGMEVVNVLAVVPKSKWDSATGLGNEITAKYPVFEKEKKGGLTGSFIRVDYEMKSPVKYEIKNLDKRVNWVVVNNAFSDGWILKRDHLNYHSVPLYSSVNAFYKRPEWKKVEVEFKGQKTLYWGLYFSFVSGLVLILSLVWFYPENKNKK